jgi:hypothetical protein
MRGRGASAAILPIFSAAGQRKSLRRSTTIDVKLLVHRAVDHHIKHHRWENAATKADASRIFRIKATRSGHRNLQGAAPRPA